MFKNFQDPGYQAFRILQVTFIIAPLFAGLDKFFYLLTDWSQYLSPFVLSFLDGHDRGFMKLVGVIEVIADLE